MGLLTLITLVAFEALAVATAMPVAARQLGGLRYYGLAFSLFLTTSLLGIVIGGGWCDRVGARTPLVVALLLFAGGLVLSGSARSFPVMLAGRAISGAGGGLEIVALFVVIAMVYPERLQPRVFAAVSAAWVLPSMIGPPVAGFLAAEVSWRAVFLVAPPLATVPPLTLWRRLARPAPVPVGAGEPAVCRDGPGSAALGWWNRADDRQGGTRRWLPGRARSRVGAWARSGTGGTQACGAGPTRAGPTRAGPDGSGGEAAGHGDLAGVGAAHTETGTGLVSLIVRGMALAVGAGLLQLGLQSGSGRAAALAFAAALLLLAASLPALLPAGTLRLARGLPSLVVVRCLLTSAYFGAETFVPLMLIEQRRLSPAMAGLALTAGAVGWAAGSWLQGRPGLLAGRITLLSLGGAVVGFSTLLLVPAVLTGVPVWVVPPVWGLSGLGMGLGMSSTSVLTLRLSQPGEEGRNSSGLQIGDALGSVIGIGAAGAVFAALHDAGGNDAAVFAIIWAGLGVIGMLSGVVAQRVRPA